MTIGQRIRARRKELHLTLKDLFSLEKIQTGNLSELENDKYLPSVQTIIPLCRALNCSIDWILTGEEHKEESLNFETLRTEQGLSCDGHPLNEMEADLVAMYRLLGESGMEEAFDYVYFKYKRHVEEKKESIYSTYTESDPEDGSKTTHGIA